MDDLDINEHAAKSASGRRTSPAARFQFTIGHILTVISAGAIIAASLFAFPPVVSAAVAGLMSVCLPAVLVICLIYGGRRWRAFAIGALTPSVMRMLSMMFASPYMGSMNSRLMISQQQMLQQMALGMNRRGASGQSGGAFDQFNQMAEFWDKIGYAYMTEETLFWGGSLVAGLVALFVHRRFAGELKKPLR
jgi:hypothetical protein